MATTRSQSAPDLADSAGTAYPPIAKMAARSCSPAASSCFDRALRRTREEQHNVRYGQIRNRTGGKLTHAVKAEQNDLRSRGRVPPRQVVAAEYRGPIRPVFTLPDSSAEDEVIHVALPHVAGKVNLFGSDAEVRQVVATRGEVLQRDGVGLDVGGDVAQCGCGSVAELGHV